MPTFNQDWFTDNIPLLEIALKDLKGKDNLVFMEIGSYEGRSAIWFLDNILTGNNCGLFCVDSFKGSRLEQENNLNTNVVYETFIENMKPYEGRFKLFQGASRDVLRGLYELDSKLDLVYVDGSHRASDTLIDMVNGYQMLKNGGFLIADDYLWNLDRYNLHETPKLAIDSFVNVFKDECKLLYIFNKLAVIQKVC